MGPEIPENLTDGNRNLLDRLEEAEETLRALRSGEVDAILVSGPDGDQVYTLLGADETYRFMVQGMAEGALTVTRDGLILFSNEQFATILARPLERVIGANIQDFIDAADRHAVAALLSGCNGNKAEVRLDLGGPARVPAYLSAERLLCGGAECLCLIVTDLSEQKRNQEIFAAEKLARSILEQAAEAILVADTEGRIIRASRAAERLAGGPVLQRRFDQVFEIVDSAGAGYPFADILAAAESRQAIENLEVAAIAGGGRRIDLLLSAAMLSNGGSEAVGCVLHLLDITERKCRERQSKFQADILEAMAEAVIAIDPSQRVKFWNAGAERLYGLSREDTLGKRLGKAYQYLWTPASGGECGHVRADGSRIVVSFTTRRIGPEHGGGMFAVIRDITESKETEAILRESEARERNRAAELQAIMETVPVAVNIARDAECRHIVGNRMANNLLRVPEWANISPSAPQGERIAAWREMKDGREIPSADLPMQTAARTGHPVRDYEFDLVFEDGGVQTWLGNAVPLFDESGLARGAVGAFVDITEHKRTEASMRQSQKLESIGLLAGGIAHDFNNLLVGVIGNASLAKELLPASHPALELLEHVVKTGEQLANLTRQMLAYSGKGQFFIERLDLSGLVPEMSGLVQPSISKKIALHFDLHPGLPPIEADRGQMHQVLMNLVLNAAEAIGAGPGVIGVRTGVQPVDQRFIAANPDAAGLKPGTYVFLEVRDTGCGMDASTRARIFDPFFTTKFTGRGLGLAAVSGVVRGHKGAIQVVSAPGKGSCFTVLFPAVRGESRVRPAAAQEPLACDGTGTILLVDDEEAVRDMGRRALSRHGFDVLVATNGLEAIDLLRRHTDEIALVLLDLSMPGLSGLEALPELRKIRPGIKVLLSSGYNEAETMLLFQGQPVAGFIQKPYTSLRLAEKVFSALH